MDLNSLILLITGAALGCFAAYFLVPRLSARDKSAPIRQNADSGMIPEQGVAQASPVPSVLIDAKGVIVSANAAAIKAFGHMDAGTALSMKFRAPEMRAAVDAAVSSGADTSFEMAERLPVERWHRVDVCHMRLSDGAKFLALFFRDQSEARKLDRMRSDFVANASHELRTPLASMTGFIETLKGPARNDEAAREKFLGIMQQQAERMARLIDDLLSLSRLEMRPVLAAGQVVDLQLTAEHVLDALRPMSAELGVVIERDIGPGPLMVAGARDELIQVIENLVENACKYGQQGRKVIVSLSKLAGEVRLSVRDFGPGIAAEHIPRLTERFYRVDAGASRAQKGTGLGLAIVKHILNRHHARLAVNSEIGGGSDFVVIFPAPDHVDK
jgi:two-component system, OmpR family, phosphate regulon sensor histidine kinase PhoR